MPGAHEHDHPAREGLRIVVGYDGSPPARRALEQAEVDASSLGHVFVVAAHHRVPAALGRPYAQRHEYRDEGPARALIAALEQGEVSALLRTRWEAEIIDGPPHEAIVHVAEARDADRIYLGTRGLGRAGACWAASPREPCGSPTGRFSSSLSLRWSVKPLARTSRRERQ